LKAQINFPIAGCVGYIQLLLWIIYSAEVDLRMWGWCETA